jgi:hypothetical protein
MYKLVKAAIFVMAMMISVAVAFGQTATQSANNGQAPINISVHVDAISPSLEASYATITYRFYDGDNDTWRDWDSKTNSFSQGWVHFDASTYSLTNVEGAILFQYQINAYNSGGSLITYDCGTVSINKYDTNVITINNWNKCLGKTDVYYDTPNSTE